MSRTLAPLAPIAAGLALALVLGCAPLEEAAPTEPGPEAPAAPTGALPSQITCERDGSLLLLVPAGQFLLGEPERPKRVTLPAFYIGRTEVTNAQYAQFLKAVEGGDPQWRHPGQPQEKTTHVPLFWTNAELGEAKRNHPVVGVDWFDAYAYARWAGKRLPTEAEWERAARGTDGRPYPWGSQPPEDRGVFRANFFGSSHAADGFQFTAPVGSFPAGASPVGCLDMGGNVTEWCGDWFAPLPADRRLESPSGPATGTQRVVKGGAWNLAAASLRSYNRYAMDPRKRLSSVGFRCARDAFPAPAATE